MESLCDSDRVPHPGFVIYGTQVPSGDLGLAATEDHVHQKTVVCRKEGGARCIVVETCAHLLVLEAQVESPDWPCIPSVRVHVGQVSTVFFA